MLKSLTRTVAGSFFLSIILAAMMGLLVVTLRWSHQGRAELKSRLRKGKPEIIIFWHEYLFVMSPVLPRRCSALQSPHPDGRVLAGLTSIWPAANLGKQQQKSPVWPSAVGWRAEIRPISGDYPRRPTRPCQDLIHGTDQPCPANRCTHHYCCLVSAALLASKKLG